MSYAIIINQKHTRNNIMQLALHNERKKKVYSNKNIDINRTKYNYHLKEPKDKNYIKEFDRLRIENNLKGQLHSNSIIACELVITSDTTFFDKIGKEETRRYFNECYNFVKDYKNLGEENIISAVIHLDEKTPHMHLMFIPVVDSIDKDGNKIRKISSSEYWVKDSYKNLQNDFYQYIRSKDFDLERGKIHSNNRHMTMEELKTLTNFYDSKKMEEELSQKETETINKEDINKFYQEEEFTMRNVEHYLLDPLIEENKRLKISNNDMRITISKAKNAVEYLQTLEKENEILTSKINSITKDNSLVRKSYNTLIQWIESKSGITSTQITEILNNIRNKELEQI